MPVAGLTSDDAHWNSSAHLIERLTTTEELHWWSVPGVTSADVDISNHDRDAGKNIAFCEDSATSTDSTSERASTSLNAILFKMNNTRIA